MKSATHQGTCQCCGAIQKLHGDRLVLHGYQRPGTGEAVGRCPAVGQPPYELSCDWIKGALPSMIQQRDALVERARALNAQEVGYLQVYTDPRLRPDRAVYREYIAGVTPYWELLREIERVAHKCAAHGRSCAAVVERWTAQMDTWELRPLIPVPPEKPRDPNAKPRQRRIIRLR